MGVPMIHSSVFLMGPGGLATQRPSERCRQLLVRPMKTTQVTLKDWLSLPFREPAKSLKMSVIR